MEKQFKQGKIIFNIILDQQEQKIKINVPKLWTWLYFPAQTSFCHHWLDDGNATQAIHNTGQSSAGSMFYQPERDDNAEWYCSLLL